MGPIGYEFDSHGTLNRSRFLVDPPLSRLFNVSIFPHFDDTHYAPLVSTAFFFSTYEFLGQGIHLFICRLMANDVQKKWPFFYGLTGFFLSLLAALSVFIDFLPLYFLLLSHPPYTIFTVVTHPATIIQSLSSSSCIHEPSASNHWKSFTHDRTMNLSFHY